MFFPPHDLKAEVSAFKHKCLLNNSSVPAIVLKRYLLRIFAGEERCFTEVKKFTQTSEDGIRLGVYYMQAYSYIWFLKNCSKNKKDYFNRSR